MEENGIKNELAQRYGDKVRVRVMGILHKNNEILLINHKGITANNIFWMPPGGGVEFGESIESCLKREFLEETGLVINVNQLLTIHEHISAPFHAIELFYEVTYISGTLKLGIDPELSMVNQQLSAIGYKSRNELLNISKTDIHPQVISLVKSYNN